MIDVNGKLSNFIDSVYQTHLDNIKSIYSVRPKGRKPIMPLTNFVFEFFIFNSLYQIDWPSSCKINSIKYHDREDISEFNQIAKFLRFIRQNCPNENSFLKDFFEPLNYLNLEGRWTKIIEDDRIKIKHGESFFNNLNWLRSNLEGLQPTKTNFRKIELCLQFIVDVRNNIFHGTKTQEEAREKSQAKRIEIYDIYLKCINSLFFSIIDCQARRNTISTQKIQFPIDTYNIETKTILSLIHMRKIKIEDSRIIYFTNSISIKSNIGDTLFYPSAGYDIITPLLIAIEHINNFYFYNVSYEFRKLDIIKSYIGKILKIDVELDKHKRTISFIFKKIRKILYFCADDNKSFLEKDISLGFYFHRGDSSGEGGSNQKWDSELLSQLKKKVKIGKECFFISDGEPGGGMSEEISIKHEKKLYSDRNRKYYFGYLK